MMILDICNRQYFILDPYSYILPDELYPLLEKFFPWGRIFEMLGYHGFLFNLAQQGGGLVEYILEN